ncbi:SDR family oxidoreductase [Rothia koreensis]|uniref:SDR family oxidoreductase n=1 Tax=Rothia koreensis TaxID=592378 RepID=UPI003F28F5C4
MDYGITGRWAIVCAASRGLGYGCAEALARHGANVVINGRDRASLEEAAEKLRAVAPKSQILPVHGDVTDDDVQGTLIDSCEQVDILVTNAGGPPPGDFRNWGTGEWASALKQNMLTPISLIKATVDHMAERGFGRIVNITSSAVKAPIPELGLSNGARGGLTGFVAGLARQPRVASRGVTINNLLPGTFATQRLMDTLDAQAESSGRSRNELDEEEKAAIPAGRYGNPKEFGAVCAFLCSEDAGYLTGQNILLDGGAYPGTL